MDETEASLKTRSYTSCGSKRSRGSSTGAAAAMARAKAEAAKTRLSYAKKEMTMKLEKAQLEAAMDMLSIQKETAAAVAEAETLEAAVESSDQNSCKFQPEETLFDPVERTREYVIEQAKEQNKIDSAPAPHLPSQDETRQLRAEPAPACSIQTPHLKSESSPADANRRSTTPNRVIFQQPQLTPDMPLPSRNPQPHRTYGARYSNHSPPLHATPSHAPQYPHHDQSSMTDFVRYFARRELVTTGLMQFNDQPQSYRAWQRSFQNAVRGLDLTFSEEMDLLVKWLGKESTEHAKRIRAVHVNHPDRGLKMIWDRLDACYGAPEVIEDALFKRVNNFPKISNRDYSKLHELSDLLMELEAAKTDGHLSGLQYLDTPRGVNPLVQKLPFSLQEKWLSLGSSYKQQNHVSFPPFEVFVDFVSQQAKIRNDPSFNFTGQVDAPPKADKTPGGPSRQKEISVHKTDLSPTENAVTAGDSARQCPIHKKPHLLRKCRAFRAKPLEERKAFLKENGICFKCCTYTQHTAKNCKFTTKCLECGSEKHISALHPGPAPGTQEPSPSTEHGGEQAPTPSSEVTTHCTEVCGSNQSDRSCSKICLVKIYPVNHRDRALKVYAIIDEHSNRSLARSEFFDAFNVQGPTSPYSLRTCSGVTETMGRRASGYQIESVDGKVSLPLPSLVECNDIPNNRSEIPTPSAASNHPHLKSVAHLIPELEPNAPIMLLLGRDIIAVHKVRKQVNGPRDAPFAQKLDLGWVIVGNVCLGGVHKPDSVNAFYTSTTERKRPSIFEPCPNVFQVKERYSHFQGPDNPRACSTEKLTCNEKVEQLGSTVFQQTKDDNKVAPSINDISFLQIMEKGLKKDEGNSWVAPLPFKTPRRHLPDNKAQALKRLSSLRHTLERKPVMKQHFLTFMEKVFQNNHAEVAPPLKEDEERWYLPTFGVYHPRKPGNIRVVFDSSAQHGGVSLNDVLLTGPDLNNTLLGVLLRFRKEAVALTADIEQMFHCFLVREEDRNFLRFLWFRDNDPSKDIIDYRMRVHVFGNSPSPAVAIYCLRQSVQEGDPDVKQFVNRDFYVDDGLKSFPTVEAAVDLLKRTQDILSDSNLRLHKIASNRREVMEAFPSQDHANDFKDLDLGSDALPMQRSLGLNWDLMSDTFTFKVANEEKPFTRRGILSTVNSIYDPLGFVAPVTIQGKAILRELTQDNGDWDSTLPQEMEEMWITWRSSLRDLSSLQIPRPYTEISPTEVSHRELCVFCDASTKAIAAVAYLKLTDTNGTIHVGFVMGKAKLAPLPEHTVPRLELCAAVLAVELAELISSEIDMQLNNTTFYSDSKVVLGYIKNETRRFYVYVSNRVQRIRNYSRPEQWQYVSTDLNPADIGTRFVTAAHLSDTSWLGGPTFLKQPLQIRSEEGIFELVNPSSDEEIRPLVSTMNTTVLSKQLGSQRFSKFSSWNSLTHAIARLIHITCFFQKNPATKASGCKGWHHCHTAISVDELSRSKRTIIHAVQEETYAQEYTCLKKGENLLKDSPLKALDPFIDTDGLLRVGGRIREAELQQQEKTPLIIPGKHHIATLLVRYYHEKTQHQGRLFTEGALRAAGFWIVGGKRRVSSVIHGCVTCRKLRGTPQTQKMAELPADRLSTEPPFTNVGLDVFGPWTVSSRRTRGGLAQSKRWAVLFTCMSVRAVHIEVIESLDTSSFINSLRRFLAIRGPVKLIRSDRGTNFVSACKELKIPSNIDNASVEKFLLDQGCTWKFNLPHASHMGGSWERMIGVARKILDSMFLQLGTSKLTHEALTTLMAEVAAIINARPLIPVSTDPDDPLILTPATLLTQKVSLPSAPVGDWVKDLHKSQWRQVQHLAQTFWDRWKKQYLSSLQPRRKWQSSMPDLQPGSIVLLKDNQLKRNEWPLGLVTQVFPSIDSRVRKVEIKVSRKDGTKVFLRPVTETVLLLAPEKKP